MVITVIIKDTAGCGKHFGCARYNLMKVQESYLLILDSSQLPLHKLSYFSESEREGLLLSEVAAFEVVCVYFVLPRDSISTN